MRGAWVTAWESGFLIPSEVDATIDAAKRAGLNALFIQVRKNADAYYSSTLEPRGAGLAPGFDPLEYITARAHAAGISVHAWINVYRVCGVSGLPTDPNHPINAHPDWINKNVDGKTRATDGFFIDPGVPAAREHIVSVAEDIARRYPIDGIHLDYIRYPGRDWGYSDIALSRFRAETGVTNKPAPDDPRWLAWRREQVTALLTDVRAKVRAVRPNAVISAATIAWGDCPADFRTSQSYCYACQDWKGWLSDGLIDAAVPMDYKSETSAQAAREFRSWLVGLSNWHAPRPVYIGIDVRTNRLADSLRQIRAVEKAHLDGFLLFPFNTPGRAPLVTALAERR